MQTLKLTAPASKLARKGHPWFYADDIAEGGVGAAGLVRVATDAGRDLGIAFASPSSRLRLRLTGLDGPDAPAEFFARALGLALARRAPLLTPKSGVRIVHGEADGLPGLVVDRYADCLVLQVSSAVVEAHLGCIVPFLADKLRARMVLARNDIAVRRFEQLPEEVRLLHGERVEEVEIEEHGLRHRVHPWIGHKTGFYLDQRLARRRVQELARGRSVLDLFSYQGAFALAALHGGATSALAVDQDEDALARARSGAQSNGLSGLETRAENAFGCARELRRAARRFDLVIVDPPAFAKSRAERAGALRGYRDLNHQALRLLAEGGLLLTCSCSHHVPLELFETLVRQAAAELPFKVVLRERILAGEDHPAWISLPESEYLKILLLQRWD